MNGPAPLKCAKHPETETYLKCGKCGKPICPKCMVQTSVGSRCKECARLYKLPTFRISPVFYLRAAGAAIVTGAAVGALWGFISTFISFSFFNLLIFAGIGWVIGEAVGLATNRKRGPWLAVIGGAGVAICYGLTVLVSGRPIGIGIGLIFDIAGLVIGIVTAVNRLR